MPAVSRKLFHQPITYQSSFSEIQGKALGLKVEIFDEAGRSIEDTGVPGELVCTRPHPTLPLGLWGDETGEKLHEAYFSTYPGVWRQGDFIVKNPQTGGFMVLGRRYFDQSFIWKYSH